LLDELAIKGRVVASASDQFQVCAVFDDTALFENKHLVGVANGAQAVRHNEARSAP
jgi:hypothetical protein